MAIDAIVAQLLTERGFHATMGWLVTLQTALRKQFAVAPFTLMRIVTRGARHFGFVEARAFRQSDQLGAGMDSPGKICLRRLIVIHQIVTGPKLIRRVLEFWDSEMALAADVQLLLPRE